MEHLDFCSDCGDLYDDNGECFSCSPKYQKHERKVYRFEYAFESLTERSSKFKKVYPIKD